MDIAQKTREWRNVDLATFRNEIVPQYRPAILKGLVRDWPAVRDGSRSPQALCDYVMRFDQGRETVAFVGPPEIKGRYFYRDDMKGVNFTQVRERFATTIERLRSQIGVAGAPSIYVGSAPIPDSLPGLAGELPLDLVDPAVVPRIWIGGPSVVAPHYDLSDNIACVVGGRRRFTFFPPEQVKNLYVGPLEFTLAGQPCSMVSVKEPDFARFPKFREALAAAEVADLAPGDAVYIPYLWWHGVESFDPVNMLINYWWTDAQSGNPAAFEALVHAILAVRSNPPERRAAWKAIFDHYIFEANGDPMAHFPPQHRGILGRMSPPLADFIRSWLKSAINR
ncbi:MAG: cupin-like domain-containing protein [Terricaulis sp.]